MPGWAEAMAEDQIEQWLKDEGLWLGMILRMARPTGLEPVAL